ncbi:MAG: hypothetical protein ACTSPB_25145 [Candidatus Thorarchaeota archaeon]
MPFDLESLKTSIRDTLRAYLYPQCLSGSMEHTLSTSLSVIEVAQSFKPYSKFYRNISPYKNTVQVSLKMRKIGTPDDDVVISLQSSSNSTPSGSTLGAYTISVSDVPDTLGVVSASIPITSMLGSNTEYWIVVSPQNTPSTTDCYSIAKDTVDSNYWMGTALERESNGEWSSLNVDLYFDVDTPNWIYSSYPRSDLSINSFPRIAIDVIGRRVNQRWIDRRLAEYLLEILIMVYSRYPDELDDLVSYVDRALFKERVNIAGIKRVDSSAITPISSVRNILYARGIRYTAIYQMVSD